jgi:hypothetical protein
MNNTHRGDIGKLPRRLRFKRAASIVGTATIGAVLVICEKIPSLFAMVTVARGAACRCLQGELIRSMDAAQQSCAGLTVCA